MTETVAVPAEDLRTALLYFSTADQLFAAALATVPGYMAATEAANRLIAALSNAAPGMPADPVGSAGTLAIQYHETLTSFMEAGFERDEAMEFLKIIVTANAGAVAMKAALRP